MCAIATLGIEISALYGGVLQQNNNHLKAKPIHSLRTMTATEKLHQLIQALPEEQINEVLHFAEFLHQKQHTNPQTKAIPLGTLTGLRGIAKRPNTAPSDAELQTDYTNYLNQK